MPGTMSVPTAYRPSLSMVVFGGPAGGDAAAAAGADVGAGGDAGAGGGAGDGLGSGSAPATAPDAAQPPRISPAATNRLAPGTAALNPIEQQRTGADERFHIPAASDWTRYGAENRLSQAPHLAGVAERMLIRLEVVPRNLRVHRAFEEDAQHRVVGVIGLVKGQHGGAVGLLLELVIPLCARGAFGGAGGCSTRQTFLGGASTWKRTV